MESMTDSVRNWKIKRPRPAPKAVRITISCCREDKRARSNPATLAQASRSTKATAPCSVSRALRASPIAASADGDERHSPSLVPFRIFLGEVRGDSLSSPLVPVRARCRP